MLRSYVLTFRAGRKKWTRAGGGSLLQQRVAAYLELPLNAASYFDVQRGFAEKRAERRTLLHYWTCLPQAPPLRPVLCFSHPLDSCGLHQVIGPPRGSPSNATSSGSF